VQEQAERQDRLKGALVQVTQAVSQNQNVNVHPILVANMDEALKAAAAKETALSQGQPVADAGEHAEPVSPGRAVLEAELIRVAEILQRWTLTAQAYKRSREHDVTLVNRPWDVRRNSFAG